MATFCPAGEPAQFHAHPLDALAAIAHDAELDHLLVPVREPYRAGYMEGLTMLRDVWGIDTLVTGDIDLVDGMPNWIQECARPLGLQVLLPLWQRPRSELLHEIVSRGIVARISWINSAQIPQSWLQRTIDDAFIADITALARGSSIDICGENGEYHTMVAAIPK